MLAAVSRRVARPLAHRRTTTTTATHWLDVRFPRASQWLLTKSKELWLRGLRERAW